MASETPWCVYILKCGDGTLYTGATNRLEVRLKAHATGKGARYTKTRQPVRLVFSEDVGEKGPALSREWALKQLTRAEKLALIRTAKKPTPRRKQAASARPGAAKPGRRSRG